MAFTSLFQFRLLAKKTLYILTVIASMILIADITIVDLPNIQKNLDIVPTQLQLWICIYFLIDFVLLMLVADNKWRYFKRYFLTGRFQPSILRCLARPTAKVSSAMAVVITEPAPVVALLPIVTGATSELFEPIKAPSPIMV